MDKSHKSLAERFSYTAKESVLGLVQSEVIKDTSIMPFYNLMYNLVEMKIYVAR